MPLLRPLVLAVVISLSAIPVFADQAAWVSRAEAAKALEILAKHEMIKHYCAPCGDKEIVDEKISSIGLFPIEGEGYWEIRVNGKGVDLAYIYFEEKPGKWVNVAMKAKIDVERVPEKLPKSLPTAGN